MDPLVSCPYDTGSELPAYKIMASCLPALSCYPAPRRSHTPACTPLTTLPASCSLAPPGGTPAVTTIPRIPQGSMSEEEEECFFCCQRRSHERQLIKSSSSHCRAISENSDGGSDDGRQQQHARPTSCFRSEIRLNVINSQSEDDTDSP